MVDVRAMRDVVALVGNPDGWVSKERQMGEDPSTLDGDVVLSSPTGTRRPPGSRRASRAL